MKEVVSGLGRVSTDRAGDEGCSGSGGRWEQPGVSRRMKELGVVKAKGRRWGKRLQR